MSDEWASIPDTAMQLKKSYNQTLRLVFIGELVGRKNGQRWEVTVESVRKFQRERLNEPS